MAEFPPEIAAAARPGLLYEACRLLVRGLAGICFRLHAHGREHVPAVGPVILAANHVSYGDPPLVGCPLRRTVHFLARNTLFDKPVLGTLIRRLHAVPVDRDGGGGAGLKAILDRLGRGAAILLFPEGTRSADGRIKPAKAGVGLAVIKSAAPVVPVRIFGSYEAWGRHRKFPLPKRVDVVYGQPIDFSALRAEAKTCDKTRLKAIYQEAADVIMATIEGLTLPPG